jgi:GNAT superfamily N-acetyltransferase
MESTFPSFPMIKTEQVKDLPQLLKVWPRLLKLEASANIQPEILLQLHLRCFQQGAIFLIRADNGIVGSALVEGRGHGIAILHSIPRDEGKGFGRAAVEAVKQWARENDFNDLQVSTTKLAGSSFRYFEKSLGFRRKSVTFSISL